VGTVRVIDSDTHVFETEDTWDVLTAAEQATKPVTEYPCNSDPNRPPTRRCTGFRTPQ
jgi:hypothetical protein